MKRLSFWVFCMAVSGIAAMPAYAKTQEYFLTIAYQPVNVTGENLEKITINGSLPGPTLSFTEADDAIVHVTNDLRDETSIHWHGVIVPKFMDGAPGFNQFAPIKPKETFTYRFPIRQSGTYWYHAHSLGQEQDGLYAAIVIAPRTPDPVIADKDFVVLLSDFTKEAPQDILAHLKMSSDFYQFHRRTLADFFDDIHANGLGNTLAAVMSWGKMRMLPTDLSDVSGYHFLLNGKPAEHAWTGLYKTGEKIRLRFINAATMSIFDVRIPGLKMIVVAADGQPVHPIPVDEFRIGNAETYDVIVQPTDDRLYTITAESLDREGFALGALSTTADGIGIAVPNHRPRPQLTMSDMNMEQMMKDNPDMDMSDPSLSAPSGWSQTGAPQGTKTLSYDDLRLEGVQPDTRPPSREINVRLGGTMQRYIWTMNGKTFSPDEGIHVAYNERIRLTYINETMMAHPIHLHGMFMQVENGQPSEKLPNKHTVLVPPGQSISVLVTANQPGSWPFHCHLLFHMAAGMMTTFIVAPPNASPSSPQMDMQEGPHGHRH